MTLEDNVQKVAHMEALASDVIARVAGLHQDYISHTVNCVQAMQDIDEINDLVMEMVEVWP